MQKLRYLKYTPCYEDTLVPEVGSGVKSGLPPICIILTIQQSGSSSPSFRLRCWCKGVMRICRASIIFSSLVLLAWSMMVSPHWMACWVFQECSATADVFVSALLWVSLLLQSGLQPPNSLSNVDLPTITGDPVDDLGVFLLWSMTLVSMVRSVCPDLKITLRLYCLHTRLMCLLTSEMFGI